MAHMLTATLETDLDTPLTPTVGAGVAIGHGPINAGGRMGRTHLHWEGI